MSKSAVAEIDLDALEWLDKDRAALYMQRKGFDHYTANSVLYAARIGKLRKGEPKGKRNCWRKEWLDTWADAE